MNVRAGDIQDPACARCHAAHDAEKIALRARIVALESKLELKSEALHRLMCVLERLPDETSCEP